MSDPIDLHDMPAMSTVDLVQAAIDELGVLVTLIGEDASPIGNQALRCLSIAFAVQEKVGTPLDQAKRPK